ncbi:MAG: hypothetical protein ACKVT0_05735, partial [Planctomycetaceae bacterium]
GFLSSGTLFLSYDPAISTPERPAWRDIGLPPGAGGWLLRVIRTGTCCYEARLSIQLMSETSVLPATIFETRSWSFRKRNILHGSLKVGESYHDVTLLVEPS